MKQEAPTVIEITPTSGALYPELPGQGAPPDQSYRLQEISRIRKNLEDEKDRRTQLEKKYRRAVKITEGLDTGLLLVCALTGVSSVGLLSTIVAVPVVIGLEVTALVSGVLGAVGKLATRRLAVKVKKHGEIRVLAAAKLNTIANHVSRALMDGVISDNEFKLIVEELSKYDQLKAEIKAGARKKKHATALDEETKNTLIQRGRDEARAIFIKKLGAQ